MFKTVWVYSKGNNWLTVRDGIGRLLRAFHASNNEHDRLTYIKARKYYKDICTSKSSHAFETYVNKLESALIQKNNKLFWSFIRSKSYRCSCNIKPIEWVQYFEQLFSGTNLSQSEVEFILQ